MEQEREEPMAKPAPTPPKPAAAAPVTRPNPSMKGLLKKRAEQKVDAEEPNGDSPVDGE